MRKVSIVMTLFNSEAHIGEAIESALAQTYKDREIIVVDDGSTDGSARVVKKFGNAVQYHYEANRGVASATNRGVRLSSGEYVAFLEHDDVWLPEKLERQVAILEARPPIGVVNCDLRYFSAAGELEEEVIRGYIPEDPFLRLFEGGFNLWISALVVRRNVFDATGGFDEGFKAAGLQDLEWYARLTRVTKAHYIPEPLVLFRRHPDRIPNGVNLENTGYMLDRLWEKFKDDDGKRRYLLRRRVSFLSDLGKHRIGQGRIKDGRQCLVEAVRLGLRERVGGKMVLRSALRLVRSCLGKSLSVKKKLGACSS